MRRVGEMLLIGWAIGGLLAVLWGCDRLPALTPPPAPPAQPAHAAPAMPVPALDPGFPIPRQAATHRNYLIQSARYYWGLEADLGLFFGQVHQESRFDESAASRFASGIAQFTPATAADMQKLYPADLQVLCDAVTGCPGDPKWALRAMLLYDRQIWTGYRFAGGDDRMGWMLAAYNGGAGNLNRERAQTNRQGLDQDRWFENVETVCLRSVDACVENRDYPRKILFKWRPGYRIWLSR